MQDNTWGNKEPIPSFELEELQQLIAIAKYGAENRYQCRPTISGISHSIGPYPIKLTSKLGGDVPSWTAEVLHIAPDGLARYGHGGSPARAVYALVMGWHNELEERARDDYESQGEDAQADKPLGTIYQRGTITQDGLSFIDVRYTLYLWPDGRITYGRIRDMDGRILTIQ